MPEAEWLAMIDIAGAGHILVDDARSDTNDDQTGIPLIKGIVRISNQGRANIRDYLAFAPST